MRRPFGLRWYEVVILIVLILMAVLGVLFLLGPQTLPRHCPTNTPSPSHPAASCF
jgi:hypothetical protein